jgi:DNA mismatch repair protein MLH3
LTGAGTSKYHATEPLLGRNGTFLASLAAMSLLTISSHHYQHRSPNVIILHQSKVVERQLPASAHHEIQGKHGTRVTVRNLFGNLPVRVKQRSIISEQRAEHDRVWDGLKKDVTSLLLSWQHPVSIRLRDSDNRVVLCLSISGSDILMKSNENKVSKPRSAQLSSLLNVLTQANYITIDKWASWVPASAATSAISIKGAISLNPAPTKHVQFISLGIRPLSADAGHNELYDTVNRLFALSSFGTIEDDTDIDEKEKIRRQSDKRFKHDGYTNRQLKARKDVDRYPMFYLRISLKDARRRSVSEDQFIGDEANLQNVMEVLGALITQWLSIHHFRPRQPRKRHERPGTASSAAEDLIVSNSPSMEGQTTPMALRGQSIGSRSATPKQSSVSAQSLKRKRSDKVASRETSERLRPGAFAEWSRIKSGKPGFFSSVSTIPKSKAEVDSGKQTDMNTSCNTKTEAFASFDIAPLPQGALSGQQLRAEVSSPTETLGTDNKENDDTILWTDPTTKQVHLLNARTGCVVPDARPRPNTDSTSLSNSITQNPKNRSMRLPTRASTAVPGKTPWLDDVLDTWENPIFKLGEQRIQQAALHEDDFDRGHHHSRHGCSRIDIDKAFNQVSTGGCCRLSKEGLQDARVITQVDKKFILVKMQDSIQVQDARAGLLVLIDQHAADERVQVESLLRQLCSPLQHETGYQSQLGHKAQVASVVLEKPTQFAVSSQERIHFTTHAARFAAWGFLYDVVKTTASAAVPSTTDSEKYVLSVTALPTVISERCKADSKVLISFLRSTVWKYAEDSHLPLIPAPCSSSTNNPTDWVRRLATCPPGLIDLINSRACRSAIMFNDELSNDDCNALVRNLAGCVFPFMCAHGRPSMVPLVDLGGLGEVAGGLGGHCEVSDHDNFVQAWKRWRE